MRRIRFVFDTVTVTAELSETATAAAIWAALPLSGTVSTWGDEVYFAVDVAVVEEATARAEVEAGELAFWLPGNAIAIAFGPTPISAAGEIRLASPCNIWGRLTGDPRLLAAVKAGSAVALEAEPTTPAGR